MRRLTVQFNVIVDSYADAYDAAEAHLYAINPTATWSIDIHMTPYTRTNGGDILMWEADIDASADAKSLL